MAVRSEVLEDGEKEVIKEAEYEMIPFLSTCQIPGEQLDHARCRQAHS